MHDQPPFLNACVRIATDLGPEALLDACKAVERERGRAQPGDEGYVAKGPRPIDVDVLLLGDDGAGERAPDAAARAGDRAPVRADPAAGAGLRPARRPDGARLSDALARLPLDEGVRRAGDPLAVPGS